MVIKKDKIDIFIINKINHEKYGNFGNNICSLLIITVVIWIFTAFNIEFDNLYAYIPFLAYIIIVICYYLYKRCSILSK